MTHFEQRCRERGITRTSPAAIRRELAQAVRDGMSDYAERVIATRGGESDIYRFRVAEGIFYAVVTPDGIPRTLYTQAMVRRKKWARKHRGRK